MCAAGSPKEKFAFPSPVADICGGSRLRGRMWEHRRPQPGAASFCESFRAQLAAPTKAYPRRGDIVLQEPAPVAKLATHQAWPSGPRQGEACARKQTRFTNLRSDDHLSPLVTCGIDARPHQGVGAPAARVRWPPRIMEDCHVRDAQAGHPALSKYPTLQGSAPQNSSHSPTSLLTARARGAVWNGAWLGLAPLAGACGARAANTWGAA